MIHLFDSLVTLQSTLNTLSARSATERFNPEKNEGKEEGEIDALAVVFAPIPTRSMNWASRSSESKKLRTDKVRQNAIGIKFLPCLCRRCGRQQNHRIPTRGRQQRPQRCGLLSRSGGDGLRLHAAPTTRGRPGPPAAATATVGACGLAHTATSRRSDRARRPQRRPAPSDRLVAPLIGAAGAPPAAGESRMCPSSG